MTPFVRHFFFKDQDICSNVSTIQMCSFRNKTNASRIKNVAKSLKSIADWYIVGDKIDVKNKDKLILTWKNDNLDYKEIADGNIINKVINLTTPFYVKFNSNVFININIVRKVKHYRSFNAKCENFLQNIILHGFNLQEIS